MRRLRRVLYVGVPNAFIPVHEREEVLNLLADMDCYPLFVGKKLAHNHFQGYCKGVLWPAFHNIIDIYNRAEAHVDTGAEEKSGSAMFKTEEADDYKEGWGSAKSWNPTDAAQCFKDYCKMNLLFAKQVVDIFDEEDVVWVNDYHLLMLPSYLRKKLKGIAPIALTLHVPFPSSEIFRTLPHRKSILDSLLCADHIGFNLYEYARHFLTCCKRMLGLAHAAQMGGLFAVQYGKHEITVSVQHVGIDSDLIHHALNQPQTQDHADKLMLAKVAQTDHFQGGSVPTVSRATHDGATGTPRMIVCVDEVEGLRGLTLKLLAFDHLLQQYPQWRGGRVVLQQFGLRGNARPDDYTQTKMSVEKLVVKINDKWGEVVRYTEEVCDLDKRLAYFKAADVLMLCPVRSGLDILPFEFLLSKGDEGTGVVVTSEFSGCSRIMNGALRINPWDVDGVASELDTALSMPKSEQLARRYRDISFIEQHKLFEWGERVLCDTLLSFYGGLDGGGAMEEDLGLGFGRTTKNMYVDGLDRPDTPGQKSDRVYSAINAKLDQNKDLWKKPLNVMELTGSFLDSQKRVLVFDYSGTLVPVTSLNTYMKTGGAARSWHYEKIAKLGGVRASRRPGGCLETRDALPADVSRHLSHIAKNPRNVVVVMSMDLREELAHAMRDFKNVILVAENGFVVKYPDREEWVECLDESIELEEETKIQISDSVLSISRVGTPKPAVPTSSTSSVRQDFQDTLLESPERCLDVASAIMVRSIVCCIIIPYLVISNILSCKKIA